MTNPVTWLNNYLQDIGKLASLSWVETSSGLSHQQVWTIECRVDGVLKGSGTGSSKADAKQIAAREALTSLRGY